MATDIIKTIGSTGDYSTLQAWEDALPANLVSADERHIGECQDEEFVTSGRVLDISGQTTDATRYVYLRCVSGASFSDNASVRSNALFYNAANGAGIRKTGNYNQVVRVATEYTRLEGLQVKADGSSQAIGVEANNCLVSRCIAQTTTEPALVAFTGGGATKFVNCLGVMSGSGICIWPGTGGFAYGCTAIKTGATAGTAYQSNYGNVTLKNCAGFNFSTFKGGGAGDAGSSHNATDLATGYGSSNVTSLTFADQFESTTNDFRAKSTGGLHAGDPDANMLVDISDFTRSLTTIWIGCWEVADAVAGGNIQVLAAIMQAQGNQFLGGGIG